MIISFDSQAISIKQVSTVSGEILSCKEQRQHSPRYWNFHTVKTKMEKIEIMFSNKANAPIGKHIHAVYVYI